MPLSGSPRGAAAAHRGIGDAVPEQDVKHEPRTVGEGEQVAQRLAGELRRGQDGYPAGQRQGEHVAAGPCADGGQDHRAQELDRAHGRQRQPVDGEVEQQVHRGEDDAQAGEHQPLTGAGRALGLPVAAFVRIRPTVGQLPKIAELAAATPEVSECHRISGDDCFLIKVHAGAIKDLETILDRFLTYGQTTTSFVVSTPVPPRTLPITG
jgi:DNA-binding Lrp family transcriptional regulator